MALRRTSIEGLRVYRASRELEDDIYKLVAKLPHEEFYRLGDGLRRSSAGISHYISESHRRHSLGLKIEALHLARTEAEQLSQHLNDYTNRGYGQTTPLRQRSSAIVGQLWALIKYFRSRQSTQISFNRAQAVDELVAARS